MIASSIKSARTGLIGLIIIVLFQLWYFGRNIDRPWTDDTDFNGAAWSQAAHNFMQAGLTTMAGVPSPFYYGPMPIPKANYYGHHPALLSWAVTASFHLFGEKESSARLIPVACSVASVILLWLIVQSCLGSRTATWSAAIFAVLPMELRWGQMVNFEPCTLMWILLGFLGLRYWNITSLNRWRNLMLFGLFMAVQTAWLGYFFVLLLCLHFWLFDFRKHRHTARLLLGICIISAVLFLSQISLANPDSIADLVSAFTFRLSQSAGGHSFTFNDWALRESKSLSLHIPLPFVAFALAGTAFILWNQTKSMRWLGWISGTMFLMNALYIIGFQNASYIHEYAAFYFTLPIAILAGIGVDGLCSWLGGVSSHLGLWTDRITGLALILALGIAGYSTTQQLNSRPHLLEQGNSGPADLIPELGRFIRTNFPPDAEILCNIDPYFTPQLWYYSKRELVCGLTEAAYWKAYTATTHRNPLGGIIWLNAANSGEIIASLDKSSCKITNIEGVPFCVWNRHAPINVASSK